MLQCLKIWFYVTFFFIFIQDSLFQSHGGEVQRVLPPKLSTKPFLSSGSNKLIQQSLCWEIKICFLFTLCFWGQIFIFTPVRLWPVKGWHVWMATVSSCRHCFPLSCSPSYCTTATGSEIPWHYQNANQKFGCCCFTRQKTPGEGKRLGSWGLSLLPFPSCQDTRPFICSALTPWAALAENMTGEVLYWTTQVPQNPTCRLVSVASQITVKDSSWGFNCYSCRNI